VSQTAESLARDFDRIARLPHDPWDHNRMYHRLLLRELPARFGAALEIGCGTGELTAKLAARAERVLALDLSPEMLAAAEARCAGLGNVELRRADALHESLAPASFDVVASVATFHHLQLGRMLAIARECLRPGGVLIALDVVYDQSALGLARSAVAFPLNLLGRLVTSGRLRPPPEVRAAWQAHGATDRYADVSEVRRAARESLGGGRVRRHLFWRYSLIWRKPSG
jgi:SAM-dependent methyltransferase